MKENIIQTKTKLLLFVIKYLHSIIMNNSSSQESKQNYEQEIVQDDIGFDQGHEYLIRKIYENSEFILNSGNEKIVLKTTRRMPEFFQKYGLFYLLFLLRNDKMLSIDFLLKSIDDFGIRDFEEIKRLAKQLILSNPQNNERIKQHNNRIQEILKIQINLSAPQNMNDQHTNQQIQKFKNLNKLLSSKIFQQEKERQPNMPNKNSAFNQQIESQLTFLVDKKSSEFLNYEKLSEQFLANTNPTKSLNKLNDKKETLVKIKNYLLALFSKMSNLEKRILIQFSLDKQRVKNFQKQQNSDHVKNYNFSFGQNSRRENKQYVSNEKPIREQSYYKDIQKLYEQFLQYKERNSGKSIHEILKQILSSEKKILKQTEDDVSRRFCIMSINFLKHHLNCQFRGDKLCCKTNFYSNSSIEVSTAKHYLLLSFEEDFNIYSKKKSFQEFYDLNKGEELARNIAGFLSVDGGCIFLGMSKAQGTTTFHVQGVGCSEEGKKIIVHKLREYVERKIYPQHKGFNISKKQIKTNETEFQINYYISVEFMKIYSNTTFLYQKQKDGGSQKYIIKIVVKPGHPQFFYHIIKTMNNDEKNSEICFCVREGTATKTQTIEALYDKIYIKLDEYTKKLQNRQIPHVKKFHLECRYDLQIDQSHYFIDEQEQQY